MEAHLLLLRFLEALIVILTSGLATAANLPFGAEMTMFCDAHHKSHLVLIQRGGTVKCAMSTPLPAQTGPLFALIAHILRD